MAPMNRRWLVQDRPSGRALAPGDFRQDQQPVAPPGEGQVLLRTRMLGFDPAQKSWMENIAVYMEPVPIGGVMPGSGVGEVLESRSPLFKPGDLAQGLIGWQEYPVVDAARLERLPSGISPEAALGVLGT